MTLDRNPIIALGGPRLQYDDEVWTSLDQPGVALTVVCLIALRRAGPPLPVIGLECQDAPLGGRGKFLGAPSRYPFSSSGSSARLQHIPKREYASYGTGTRVGQSIGPTSDRWQTRRT